VGENVSTGRQRRRQEARPTAAQPAYPPPLPGRDCQRAVQWPRV